jgi:predicted nucleotidyltransferase
MTVVEAYRSARRDEEVARLRRVLALQAMVAEGMTQKQIAEVLGISQPAVSQQLKYSPDLGEVHPEMLLEAAAPVLAAVAESHGYDRLAAFGSVARRQARRDSDIDLIVEAPPGTSTFSFIRFRQLIERVLGREVDLISYAGLKPRIDDDIRREAVLL